MAKVSRRSFLGKGSMAVAAAGVLSSVPGLSSLFSAAETEAPAGDAAAGDAAAVAGAEPGALNLSEPLVAHVRDVSSGEISLFNGTREIIVRDPQLAGRLVRAAR